MAHVIAFANHKGGVTKTTSIANTGAALVEHGRRVLLVDGDPQTNLTAVFGAVAEPGPRLEDLLADPSAGARPLAHVDGRPLAGGVHLIPCTEELADVGTELVAQRGYETRLREALQPLTDDYDFILVDTPPGIGILSGLALIAADAVIVPSRPADHDIGGAARVHELVEQSFKAPDVNPGLELLGVLITCTQARWRLRRDSHEALAEIGMPVLPVEIPFSVRVGHAPRYGAPTSCSSRTARSPTSTASSPGT